MKFEFLSTEPDLVDLRPNSATRKWMDETTESFAYRCLPLNIANAHGWSFHLKQDILVHWDGGITKEAITIKSDKSTDHIASNIFGHGILTFHTHGVFRTEPGWDLMVGGSVNEPKDGIAPLTGIIETDWSPYSFTMNWKFTRPNQWISFKEGDVFCNVMPVQRGVLETLEPEIKRIESDEKLNEEHRLWNKSRQKFTQDLLEEKPYAVDKKWQKDYYRGRYPDGSDGPKDHIIKLRLKEFKKKF
jgi:hypothetical protein